MSIGYPNADISNPDGWVDQSNGTFNIYTSIDEPELPSPNITDYVTVDQFFVVAPGPNRAYTLGLSSPGALAAGESYLMSCYADAAYSSGGARSTQWELLQGVSVIESVFISLSNVSGPTHFTHVVAGTVTDPTQLRYRFTLLNDNSIFRITVYQCDIRPVFPHLDVPNTTASRRIVAPFSGSGLTLGAASPVLVLATGAEVPSTLVVSGPVPKMHG